MTRRSTLALLGVIALQACGGGLAVGRDRAVISREELATDDIATLSAYDAVQRLRPGWLSPRGASSVSGSANRFPGVMLSNNVMDDVAILHTLPVTDVESMRYLDARDATTRFGTGYVNGLIEIFPRTGSR